MRWAKAAAVTMVVALLLALAGCGDDDSRGFMGGSQLGSEASDDVAMSDVRFAAMMLPHHRQAQVMSDRILAEPRVPAAVADLARRIRAAQGPEIDQMNRWLRDWGHGRMPMGGRVRGGNGWVRGGNGWVQGGHGWDRGGNGWDRGGHGASAMRHGGMLSAGELHRLSAAHGSTAVRLVLVGMIRHHEGAIAMARVEVRNGRYPEALTLARHIITSQRAEIGEMRRLLRNL